MSLNDSTHLAQLLEEGFYPTLICKDFNFKLEYKAFHFYVLFLTGFSFWFSVSRFELGIFEMLTLIGTTLMVALDVCKFLIRQLFAMFSIINKFLVMK